MKDARASMRKDRRARAEGLFSESSVVMNAEFRNPRPAATTIKTCSPKLQLGPRGGRSPESTDEFIKRHSQNHDSKPHKGLAANALHRRLP